MDRPDSRSEQRPGLRLDDRDEGTECDAGSGLRLRRNVLRRPDLEAGQLRIHTAFLGKGLADPPPGLFAAFIAHSAAGVLDPTAAASSLPAQDPVVMTYRFAFAIWILGCFMLGGTANVFAMPSPIE